MPVSKTFVETRNWYKVDYIAIDFLRTGLADGEHDMSAILCSAEWWGVSQSLGCTQYYSPRGNIGRIPSLTIHSRASAAEMWLA